MKLIKTTMFALFFLSLLFSKTNCYAVTIGVNGSADFTYEEIMKMHNGHDALLTEAQCLDLAIDWWADTLNRAEDIRLLYIMTPFPELHKGHDWSTIEEEGEGYTIYELCAYLNEKYNGQLPDYYGLLVTKDDTDTSKKENYFPFLKHASEFVRLVLEDKEIPVPINYNYPVYEMAQKENMKTFDMLVKAVNSRDKKYDKLRYNNYNRGSRLLKDVPMGGLVSFTQFVDLSTGMVDSELQAKREALASQRIPGDGNPNT